jgi:hypothetical protein
MVTAACKLAAFLFNLLVSFIGEGNWNTTMYLQKETGKQGLAAITCTVCIKRSSLGQRKSGLLRQVTC